MNNFHSRWQISSKNPSLNSEFNCIELFPSEKCVFESSAPIIFPALNFSIVSDFVVCWEANLVYGIMLQSFTPSENFALITVENVPETLPE